MASSTHVVLMASSHSPTSDSAASPSSTPGTSPAYASGVSPAPSTAASPATPSPTSQDSCSDLVRKRRTHSKGGSLSLDKGAAGVCFVHGENNTGMGRIKFLKQGIPESRRIMIGLTGAQKTFYSIPHTFAALDNWIEKICIRLGEIEMKDGEPVTCIYFQLEFNGMASGQDICTLGYVMHRVSLVFPNATMLLLGIQGSGSDGVFYYIEEEHEKRHLVSITSIQAKELVGLALPQVLESLYKLAGIRKEVELQKFVDSKTKLGAEEEELKNENLRRVQSLGNLMSSLEINTGDPLISSLRIDPVTPSDQSRFFKGIPATPARKACPLPMTPPTAQPPSTPGRCQAGFKFTGSALLADACSNTPPPVAGASSLPGAGKSV